MAFVKNPLNATEPREIIEYSQDLEDRTEEAFDDVDGVTTSLSSDVNTLNNFKDGVVDYVVDFGENANGRWEKWNSGKLVQSGYTSIQGHNESNPKNVLYPIPFANNQAHVLTQLVRNADNIGASPSVVVNRIGSTSTYFRTYHSSTEAIAIFIYYEAVGTWK